jgi:Flp pilus assembly pilin Flp
MKGNGERAARGRPSPGIIGKRRKYMVDRLRILAGRALSFRLEDLKREDGQTTVEYAVIVALVIALAVAAFAVLSPAVQSFMGKVGDAIADQLP